MDTSLFGGGKACDRTLSRGQLIANALGAAVSRNRYQELGWSTVQRVPNLPKESFLLPEK